MKKFVRVILSIILIVPMLVGCLSTLGLFSSSIKTETNTLSPVVENSMGGGGYNSLKEPILPDFPQKDDEEEVITYTPKTYEDYFTDLNITKETITEKDVTGQGTQLDPYVVHSTRGFLYLTNRNLIGTIANKYIELGCDVVLNDETFDENGNPSGGDGKYYNYYGRLMDGNGLSFNGKGHTISGFYCKNEVVSSFGLFSGVTLNNLENLNLSNVYLYANGMASVVAGVCRDVENVTIMSGYVYGTNSTGAIARELTGTARNCKNYAHIKNTAGETGGIFGTVSSYGVLENCKNYGSVTSKSNCGGLVSGGFNAKVTFINCENYGTLTLTGGALCGGMIASAWSTVQVLNCKNYGEIVNSSSGSGGLVGYVNGNLLIENSGNFAKIDGSSSVYKGALIGAVVSSNLTINIKNCTTNSNKSLIGRLESGKSNIQINVNGLRFFEDIDETISRYAIVASDVCTSAEINVKNVYVNVNLSKNAAAQVYLLPKLQNNTKCNVKNVIFNLNSEYTFAFKSLIGTVNANTVVDGVVINYVEKGNKINMYVGSNFKDFYVSWKTGKIGLRTIDGALQFQGEVTEDVLMKKGYEKKAV